MTIVTNQILKIESPAFFADGLIPVKFTCQGENINPELAIRDIPAAAKTIVLIVDDPDSAGGTYTHWIMWNIPVKDKIDENSAPGIQGLNDRNENKYTGPCPPSGTHHYHFRVYALDTKLNLPAKTDRRKLLNAINEHIIASGEIVGLFKK
jgi:Raf kinase inhibitor-like YbhB/YbcL family protein